MNTHWHSTQCKGAVHPWWRKACPPGSACTGSTWSNPRASDGPCRRDPAGNIGGTDKTRLTQPHNSTCSIFYFFLKLFFYPSVAPNGLFALLAGIGVQAFVTFHTVGILLSQNILLAKQGLLAVVAVIALGHSAKRLFCYETKEREKKRFCFFYNRST